MSEKSWSPIGSRSRVIAGVAALFLAGLGIAALVWPPGASGGLRGPDKGPDAAAQKTVLYEVMDPTSKVIWQVVAYPGEVPGSYCIDLLGTRASGEGVGGPGGCDQFDGKMTAILTGQGVLSDTVVEIASIEGSVLVPDSPGSTTWNRVTLVGGVVTCRCGLHIYWTDGTKSLITADTGGFVVPISNPVDSAGAEIALDHIEILSSDGALLKTLK